jgi:hypothetical protein
MSKVYVGDVGTIIVLDCGRDVSAATARAIEVRKPSGAEVSWPASASGTDSIEVTAGVGALDEAGRWKLQSHVTLPSGQWRGETTVLEVFDPFAP